MNRRDFSKAAAVSFAPVLQAGRDHSLLFGSVEPATHPTSALPEFEQLQFGVSFHFTMNTFKGNDYESGGVPASTFNATHLDVRQWIQGKHG